MGNIVKTLPAKRRAPRVGFELMVRCNYGLARSTIILKDMTRHGARIEGLHAPQEGEALSLMLPGEAPRLAFVVWARGDVAGLEFGDPLSAKAFDVLVRNYAIGVQPAPTLMPPAPHQRAAA